MNSDLAYLSATEMLTAFRARRLSPVEVTEACLHRIAELDDRVNAFCLVDEKAALRSARESEKRWHRGDPCGRLDGVPVAVKDLLLTRGWPTLRGSRTVDPEQAWDEDAPCVARMREAGAVFLGKTTTPELGWKGVTDGPLTGITRNPWDPATTSGGSSGGSAVAVALGQAPLAVGTDGGGSIRIPAGFCGIYGLKPTYGRVPIYPPSPFGTLSHAGPMTWTVQDAELLLDVIAGPDSRDWSALPVDRASRVDALEAGIAGRRIAFSADLGYVDVDPEVAGLVRKAVDVLRRLGADISEQDPGFADPIRAYSVLWFAGAAKSVAGLPAQRLAMMDPGLREICAEGARYSALDYLDATADRMELGVLMGRFHDTYDLLVTPTLPIAAFAAGRETPDGAADRRWMTWTPFSYPFNLTQQPAATVPCGFTAAGLPVGLQIVGRRGADNLVLAASKAFQDAAPWQDRRPALSPRVQH
jgi:aspartyl-tRNA(Asn)/glutamyl-tRNA(Gln) amidotransferase subunit A